MRRYECVLRYLGLNCIIWRERNSTRWPDQFDVKFRLYGFTVICETKRNEMKFCNLGNGNMLMICKIEIYILQIISIFPFRNITDFHFVSFLKLQQAVVCLMISVLSYVMTLGEPPCLIT